SSPTGPGGVEAPVSRTPSGCSSRRSTGSATTATASRTSSTSSRRSSPTTAPTAASDAAYEDEGVTIGGHEQRSEPLRPSVPARRERGDDRPPHRRGGRRPRGPRGGQP